MTSPTTSTEKQACEFGEPWSAGTFIGLVEGRKHESLSIWPADAVRGEIGSHICLISPLETATDEDRAIAERICACVNACAGLENPLDWVERVKKALPRTKDGVPVVPDMKVWFNDHKNGLNAHLVAPFHEWGSTDDDGEDCTVPWAYNGGHGRSACDCFSTREARSQLPLNQKDKT